jgi:hypothetical protein
MRACFECVVKIWHVSVISVFLFSLSACESETEHALESEKVVASSSSVNAPPAKSQPDKDKPLNVRFFLEYSGGMKGFMPAGSAGQAATEFQKRIGSLVTETQVNPLISEKQFFLISTNGSPQSQPFNKILGTVEGLNSSAALGTELPEMLSGIMALPGADQQVNIVISDFIYGPDIKASFALLPALIRSAIAPVSQKKLAVAVLAEKSHFYGTYYPAVKMVGTKSIPRRQLSGELVPYYTWIIGPPALVSRYVNQVAKNLPLEQAFYGFTLPQLSYSALLTKISDPTLKPSGLGTIFINTDVENSIVGHDLAADVSGGPIDFTVALNLSGLPRAWQQPTYLVKNLDVQLSQGQASLSAPAVTMLTAVQKSNSPILAPYTHAVRLRLSKLQNGTTPLMLTLRAPETPRWIVAWSTSNDSQSAGQTFGLQYILQGVRESYPESLPPVFTARFTVKNDE